MRKLRNKIQANAEENNYNIIWSYCIIVFVIIFTVSMLSFLVLWVFVLLLNLTSRILNRIATIQVIIAMISFGIICVVICIREVRHELNNE